MENEFIFIPEGDHHVTVPLTEADGKALLDVANGYRGAVEWSFTSHDGVSNVTIYFINEKDLNDENNNFNGKGH